MDEPIIVPQAAIDAYEAKEAQWRKPEEDKPEGLPLALVAFLEEL